MRRPEHRNDPSQRKSLSCSCEHPCRCSSGQVGSAPSGRSETSSLPRGFPVPPVTAMALPHLLTLPRRDLVTWPYRAAGEAGTCGRAARPGRKGSDPGARPAALGTLLPHAASCRASRHHSLQLFLELHLHLFWRRLVFPEASQLFGLCLLVRTISSAPQVFKCTREPRAPRLRGFTPGPFAYACNGPRGVSIRVAHAPRVRTPIAGLLRPAPHLVSPSVAHHGKYHLAHLVAPSRNRDIAPVRTRLSRLSSVRHQVPAASPVCPWSRCRCRPVGLVESALPSSVCFSLSMCGIRF